MGRRRVMSAREKDELAKAQKEREPCGSCECEEEKASVDAEQEVDDDSSS